MIRGWIVAALLFCSVPCPTAQETPGKLPRADRINGSRTLGALEELEETVRAVTVGILDGDEIVALGTVVRGDGVILTKASELGWATRVRLADDRKVTPVEVIVDPDNDLAILRLEERFDSVVRFSDPAALERGHFLASPVGREARVSLGIVSADSRIVKRQGGVLGIRLGRSFPQEGVEVAGVEEETGAARAGIRNGDIIHKVQGTEVREAAELIGIVTSHFPGESIAVEIKRGDRILALDVVLGYRSDYFGHLDRNQRMSGETSIRMTGFDRVLQHDIPIDVRSMGGPVADLRGRFFGINIARPDRVAGYVLPGSLLREILASCGDGYRLP